MGHDQPGHVLDADRVAPKRVEVLGHLDERRDRMNRTCRVAYRTLKVRPDVLDLFHRLLHVPDVVECIKDPENIDSALCRCVYELLHNVIGIMPVAYEVLTTQEHLDGSAPQFGLQLSQAVPGVIVEKPDAAVKGRPTPGFNREETNFINSPGKRKHILSPHPGSDK